MSRGARSLIVGAYRSMNRSPFALRVQVAGAAGGIARALHGRFAVVPGVAAEPALVDLPVGRAVEGKAHSLEVEHRVDRLAAHDFDGVLVAEEVAAFDRVVRVPL